MMPNNVYMHSEKAINAEVGSADRVFIQVGTLYGAVLAWKCAMNEDGTVYVPWAPNSRMTLTEAINAAPLKGDNGSEPTALFKFDSFYKVVEV